MVVVVLLVVSTQVALRPVQVVMVVAVAVLVVVVQVRPELLTQVVAVVAPAIQKMVARAARVTAVAGV